ncbi:uncharacterized protein Dere_GG26798 [Drosophila erecta]|uniref:Uncharacterized protein n=1 Tax=Drosophila erecta TaxID=7220 RepID=A0A0Q5T5L7_DROER|nr:uncharacterized protein Dere_GG26798 [Drosophila erecta]
MEKFVQDTLSKCLNCVVTDQMMSAILNIKDDYEFDSYFGNLLSEDNEEHRMFLLNCRRMLLSGKQPRNSGKNRSPHKQLTPTSPPKDPKQNISQGAKGKSGKYANLYATDGRVQGDTILLKGPTQADQQLHWLRWDRQDQTEGKRLLLELRRPLQRQRKEKALVEEQVAPVVEVATTSV